MENRFAAARRRYLRTRMDGIYTGMLLTGTLEPHLKEIGESAQAMFDRLIEQMKKTEGVTEQLKAADQMEWVGRMNSIRSRAEEIVFSELVCC
ncbi:TnpV protein [bacterium]|nr:TnpV protein [bacterium]